MTDHLETIKKLLEAGNGWGFLIDAANARPALEALVKEVEELRKAREWQIIENAPSDSQPVFVYSEGKGRVGIVQAQGDRWREASARSVTHWMPIAVPQPPKGKDDE